MDNGIFLIILLTLLFRNKNDVEQTNEIQKYEKYGSD